MSPDGDSGDRLASHPAGIRALRGSIEIPTPKRHRNSGYEAAIESLDQ